MAKTDTFRRAHDELLALAGEISKHLNAAELEKDAAPTRKLLSQLSGKLIIHLTMEDNSLYPAVAKHDDPKLQATLKEFNKEMGGIKEAFTGYTKKWSTPDTIAANASAFIKETKDVFAALSARIDRENKVLYNMIDALG